MIFVFTALQNLTLLTFKNLFNSRKVFPYPQDKKFEHYSKSNWDRLIVNFIAYLFVNYEFSQLISIDIIDKKKYHQYSG